MWLPEGGAPVQESYVNLVPTAQGGTHVNGFRTGLTEAVLLGAEAPAAMGASLIAASRSQKPCGSRTVLCGAMGT